MSAAALSLAGVTRRFGGPEGTRAVDALTLDVQRGELLALVGASGSGKTTTLRIIAGHEMPDEGRVLLDGRDITALPPRQRGFGMVFQHYALVPAHDGRRKRRVWSGSAPRSEGRATASALSRRCRTWDLPARHRGRCSRCRAASSSASRSRAR